MQGGSMKKNGESWKNPSQEEGIEKKEKSNKATV